MLDSIGDIEFQEKKQKVFHYLKYFIVIFLIIPIYFLIRNFIVTYGDIERNIVNLAKNYIEENNISLSETTYIPLGLLGEVEGAELCSNASGVIITKNKNKYKYQTYLKCFDYETKLVDNSEKYITLSGDPVTILNKNEIYEEMGFYTEADVEVLTEGTVLNKQGIYTINYKIYADDKLKDTVVRKVIVTSYDKSITNSGVTSDDKPTLTLLGNSIMILDSDEKYKEPGYRAVDYKDGKITRQVVVSNNVENGKLGTYNVTYSITNSNNKTTTKTRTVRVVEQKSDILIDSKIIKQTDGFSIQLKITGSGYSYTILPNGKQDTNTSLNYKIVENGIYKFAVYDIYGNVNVREVDVNDVDITGPTGNCVANVNKLKTVVIISASDKSGLSGYNYVIDGISTGFIANSSYITTKKSSSAIAQVKDSYGNMTTMTCRVNDISSSVGTMTNGIMNMNLLIQTNYREPIPYGTQGKTATVKKSGCGPTSVSMIITYLTGDMTQTPQTLFEWLNSINYYHGAGFGKAALTRAAKKYGVTCTWKNLDADGIRATLLSGYPIIAFMGPKTFTTGAHYIVLKGVDANGLIAVNDPNSEKRSKKTYDPELIIKESLSKTPFAVCGI